MDHRGNEKEAGYTDLTQIAKPGSNPSSGTTRVYVKSDGRLYTLDSSGNEVALVGSPGSTYQDFTELSATPATPPASTIRVYAKTDGKLYALGPDSVELLINTSQNSGPGSITSLYGWWKGSEFDSSTDGSEITAWTDNSSLGTNLSAIGGAGNRILVARNAINTNMTALSGNGAKSGLNSALTALTTFNTYSWYSIVKFNVTSNTNNAWAILGNNSPPSSAQMQRIGESGVTLKFGEYFGNTQFSTQTFSTGTWYCVVFSNSSGTPSLWVNNVAWTISAPSYNSTTINQMAAMQGDNAGGEYFNGYLAELALYNKALSSSDAQSLWNYSKTRFGLS
jgi:Concanavalin A-like lectin/glucanases superfamily